MSEGDNDITVHGYPKEWNGGKDVPRSSVNNYLQEVTYEDGCKKSTWMNFHENGHQHVCVCGQYDPHNALAAAQARAERLQEDLTLERASLGPARLQGALTAFRAERVARERLSKCIDETAALFPDESGIQHVLAELNTIADERFAAQDETKEGE